MNFLPLNFPPDSAPTNLRMLCTAADKGFSLKNLQTHVYIKQKALNFFPLSKFPLDMIQHGLLHDTTTSPFSSFYPPSLTYQAHYNLYYYYLFRLGAQHTSAPKQSSTSVDSKTPFSSQDFFREKIQNFLGLRKQHIF